MLVDAGPDYAGAWDTLREAVAVRLPDVVVTTHGHSDHAGLGSQWQAAGVPVVLHAADHFMVTNPRLSQDWEWRVFEDYVSTTGAPAPLQADVLSHLRKRGDEAKEAANNTVHAAPDSSGHWPTGIRMTPYQPDDISVASETLAAAGVELVACPGHTPGNAVVAVQEEGILFSGDQLLPDITPTPGVQAAAPRKGVAPTRLRSLPAFVRSLEALDVRAWSRCYPGHGPEFADVRGRIAENLRGIEERSEKVRRALRQRGPSSVYDVSMELYPRALGRRFWQIIATVQGNLDLLEDMGEATVCSGVYEVSG